MEERVGTNNLQSSPEYQTWSSFKNPKNLSNMEERVGTNSLQSSPEYQTWSSFKNPKNLSNMEERVGTNSVQSSPEYQTWSSFKNPKNLSNMEERVGTKNLQSSPEYQSWSSFKNPKNLPDGRICDSKLYIPKDIFNHTCNKRQRANEMMIQSMDLNTRFEALLDEWNIEFMNAKYVQEEYEQRLNAKTKEASDLESQLAKCRAELTMVSNSLSHKQQEVDLISKKLIKVREKNRQRDKAFTLLAVEKKGLQDHISESEATILDVEARKEIISLKAIEDFKKSLTYQREINDRVEEFHDKIFRAEVRDLERESLEEGFFRGFLKGVRLVQRKLNVVVEGLSPSQASEDPRPELNDDDDDDIESEFRSLSSDDGEDG